MSNQVYANSKRHYDATFVTDKLDRAGVAGATWLVNVGDGRGLVFVNMNGVLGVNTVVGAVTTTNFPTQYTASKGDYWFDNRTDFDQAATVCHIINAGLYQMKAVAVFSGYHQDGRNTLTLCLRVTRGGVDTDHGVEFYNSAPWALSGASGISIKCTETLKLESGDTCRFVILNEAPMAFDNDSSLAYNARSYWRISKLA